MQNRAAAHILLTLFGIFLMMQSLAATRRICIYIAIMIVTQGSCLNSWIKLTRQVHSVLWDEAVESRLIEFGRRGCAAIVLLLDVN